MVLDKPAGLVVHPAPGHATETLSEQLEREAAGAWTPHLVHRLDRDTSGLMVVAKDEPTQLDLRAQLRRRELTREYLALISGALASRSGTIDAPIGRDRRRRTRMSTDTGKARNAVTHFQLERSLGVVQPVAPATGDRAHPPDPCPPGGDRASDLRRQGVRRRPDRGPGTAVPAQHQDRFCPSARQTTARMAIAAARRPLRRPGAAIQLDFSAAERELPAPVISKTKTGPRGSGPARHEPIASRVPLHARASG